MEQKELLELFQMVLERDSSDYVTRVRLGDEMLQGESVRTLLHLPSEKNSADG